MKSLTMEKECDGADREATEAGAGTEADVRRLEQAGRIKRRLLRAGRIERQLRLGLADGAGHTAAGAGWSD